MSETTPTHHQAEVLMNLVIILLTPMFLAAAEGNLAFARQAAIETLNAYRTETGSDLITIAKIIGFGLAVLAALSRSMAEDLPIATLLRLHASANASDRAEHRNRQALAAGPARQHTPSQQPPWETPMAPEPDIDEAALTAKATEMQALTAENLARFTKPAPQPVPTITEEERHDRATWAASAATIAAETAASLSTLPPQERQSAAIWINVLNDCANDFMAGNIPLPRPTGDPAATIPPTGT